MKKKKMELFIALLREIIQFIMQKENKTKPSELSGWNVDQLETIVLPEMKELLFHALEGDILFKHGKSQRLLESTYLMTDSLEKLSGTSLGKMISELQKMLDSL